MRQPESAHKNANSGDREINLSNMQYAYNNKLEFAFFQIQMLLYTKNKHIIQKDNILHAITMLDNILN